MYVPNSLQWIHALLWSCQIPSIPAPRETYIWSWHLKACTYISLAIWTRPLAHATQTATNFGTSVCAAGGNHLDSSESSISTSLPSKECWIQVYCNDVSMPKLVLNMLMITTMLCPTTTTTIAGHYGSPWFLSRTTCSSLQNLFVVTHCAHACNLLRTSCTT